MSITREGRICSFCGTPGGPGTDLPLVGGLGAQVCARCVDDFHAILHDEDRLTSVRASMPWDRMSDPELLLLDEPGAGLDLGGREDLVTRLDVLAADDAAPALVMVTHHVEEVPSGFTHALLLRSGTVTAAGPIRGVLTDAHLTECFGTPIAVHHDSGRWFARRAG